LYRIGGFVCESIVVDSRSRRRQMSAWARFLRIESERTTRFQTVVVCEFTHALPPQIQQYQARPQDRFPSPDEDQKGSADDQPQTPGRPQGAGRLTGNRPNTAKNSVPSDSPEMPGSFLCAQVFCQLRLKFFARY
jgi:hypothetical protein